MSIHSVQVLSVVPKEGDMLFRPFVSLIIKTSSTDENGRVRWLHDDLEHTPQAGLQVLTLVPKEESR